MREVFLFFSLTITFQDPSETLMNFIYIQRHVSRVANVKEDALEALYERRLKKKAAEKQKEESALQVDPVDALPVKTLDGELYYRTGILLFSFWPFTHSSFQ